MRTLARLMPLLVLLSALPACRTTAKVRAEAAPVLNCPEGQLKVEEHGPSRYVVTGCGRMASCWLPEVEGAVVQCEGGAQMLPPSPAPAPETGP